MKTLIVALLILVAVAVVLNGIGRRAFLRLSKDRLFSLRAHPVATGDVTLPSQIRRFAEAGGASRADLAGEIQLIQQAQMRLKRGGDWAGLTARQWIATRTPGFLWHARQSTGLFDKFRVIDSFADGEGLLHVRLFGSIPIVTARGRDIDTGEAMRYLAELPWAPDAILGNTALVWEVLGEDRVKVVLRDKPEMAVELILNEAGDIAGMWAMRPVRDDAGKVEQREWVGHFSDYRQVGDRRIPAKGEVGYVTDGVYEPYFRGEITGCSVKP